MAANDKQYGGSHYKDMGVQLWQIIDTWPKEQAIGFYRGNVLKYTMRMGAKGELLKDAEKALHYSEKLVEICEKK